MSSAGWGQSSGLSSFMVMQNNRSYRSCDSLFPFSLFASTMCLRFSKVSQHFVVLQMSVRPSEGKWLHQRAGGGAKQLKWLLIYKSLSFYWWTARRNAMWPLFGLIEWLWHSFDLRSTFNSTGHTRHCWQLACTSFNWIGIKKSLLPIFGRVDLGAGVIEHAKASHSAYTPISYSVP